MDFNVLTENLSAQLKMKLPGIEAHKKMIPKERLLLPSETELSKLKKSAVLIVLNPYKGKPFITFIKRIENGSIHSGQIAFPGGKFEPGDSSLIETALREAEEEIGIIKDNVKILGTLSQMYIPVSQFAVQPIVGKINFKPEYIINSAEVDSVYNISLQEVLSADIILKEIIVRNQMITAPFFVLNDIRIWGATAMILSEFITIIKSLKL
jgi:8-oxo-dGTP pyrophosphatase MutT (NUDIX family)